VTAWVTLADFGTAVGTLVLAGATFVSVRASARSTRIAERALLAGQRPVLISTRRAGFWQAALRDPGTRLHGEVTRAIATRGRVTVDLLYGDHEGSQPSVTRFVLLPEDGSWRCDATRYWSLRPGEELRDFGFRVGGLGA